MNMCKTFLKNTGLTPAKDINVKSYIILAKIIADTASQDSGGYLTPNDEEIYFFSKVGLTLIAK